MDLQSIDLIGNKIHDLLYDRKACKTGGKKNISALLITHTGQILDYIGADRAYVMDKGRIRCSGRPTDLLATIRKNGYGDCETCQNVIVTKL